MNVNLLCDTAPLFPAGSPTETISTRYTLGGQPASYVGQWEGQPVAHPRPEDGEEEWVRAQTGYCQPHPGPSVGNYLVRRDPVALVSGDLPRVAWLEYQHIAHISPTPYLLGDVRIQVTIAGQACWLDEHGRVETQYFPWGTEHHITLDTLTLTLTAALAGTRGLALSLTIARQDDTPVEVQLCYGGLGLAEMRGGDRPECLLLHAEQEAQNRIVLAEGAALCEDEAIPFAVRVQAEHAEAQLIADTDGIRQRAAFRWVLGEQTTRLHLVAGKQTPGAPALDAALAEQYIDETRGYYAELLASVEIHTPDPLLDAAWYSAVVGMDYVYAAPGWLEGLTNWSSYYSDNYQISAAVALRQDARAKAAVRFFSAHPAGAGQVYRADGSVDDMHAPHDGLLYLLLQLFYYWQATGDRATLAEVWPTVRQALERFIALRDADGDGLLDFHKGCNAFLYQADHLSLPGVAFSPSVMLAAMLQRMAEMAEALGETARAEHWRRQACRIYQQLREQCWSPAEGRFLAAIDPQGRQQVAAYYTDYAFPALYTDLPAAQRYRSLLAMDRALSLGPCLLRTGDYLPDLFGNNGVHQVGMCEAAEAQCRGGRAQRGWELLHGVAAGATVISYCPGTFYEFASWDGQGLLNKHFGNPIGSYVQAVVTGLFGFIRAAAPAVQAWQPAIPACWPQARLRIGGVEMTITGEATARCYSLRLDAPQAVALRLPLHGQVLARVVDADGQELAGTCEAHPAGGFLHLELPAAAEHSVTVTLQPSLTPLEPAQPLPRVERAHRAPAMLSGRREALDLTAHFNHDRIRPDSFWNYTFWSPGGELSYDLRPYLEPDGQETGVLAVGDYRFTVRPHGENLVALALGDFDAQTNLLEVASVPPQFTLPIGQAISGLEFLTVAEPRVRLTGMEVGCVEYRYADGDTRTMPLIVGEYLDATLSPYATRTTTRKLARGHHGLSKHLSAWHLAVDADRVTDTVTVRITSFDMMLGILAINARH